MSSGPAALGDRPTSFPKLRADKGIFAVKGLLDVKDIGWELREDKVRSNVSIL